MDSQYAVDKRELMDLVNKIRSTGAEVEVECIVWLRTWRPFAHQAVCPLLLLRATSPVGNRL